MLIRILRPRRLQNAGTDIPLSVDDVCDLPDVVARSLIATGAAVRHEERR